MECVSPGGGFILAVVRVLEDVEVTLDDLPTPCVRTFDCARNTFIINDGCREILEDAETGILVMEGGEEAVHRSDAPYMFSASFGSVDDFNEDVNELGLGPRTRDATWRGG